MFKQQPFEAYLDELTVITILIPNDVVHERAPLFFLCDKEQTAYRLTIRSTERQHLFTKYECTVPFIVELGKRYVVYTEEGWQAPLQVGAVMRTKAFDDLYAYDGNDLGAMYKPEKTTFKVWAPTATNVLLKLIHPTTKEETTYEMIREQKGVWTYTIYENVERFFYTYMTYVNFVWREAVDPYAKAVSVNGTYGVVVDLTKTNIPKPTMPPFISMTDAIIYEMHVRDFTIHPKSGVKHKGKYLGLTERDTFGPNETVTGLSYVKQLGVTHVQLMPVQDFEGVDELQPLQMYNWGYNTVHYNAPEGSYATDPTDPYARIIELKQAIRAFQNEGIRVILDVVYNHVYIRETSSFEHLVPGYYFRYGSNGYPSNGTGVGNDLASERKMVRKFIIDSVMHWLNEYGVDGFRFDLMGILDIDTMNDVRRAIDAIDPTVIVLGEGWELATPLSREKKTMIANAKHTPRIAYFNDRFRDYVKGSTFQVRDRGFALGDCSYKEAVMEAIRGSIHLFFSPRQSVNYVECHDNHTLWDKMMIANAHESEYIRRKRQKLATAIVLLSQGIPFLHSGQEFYRTKRGIENSYNAPDEVNQIDWERKNDWEEDVREMMLLIALRKRHGAFRFLTADQVRRHMKFYDTHPSVIAYQLVDVGLYGPWEQIVVVHHNEEKKTTFPLSEGEWKVVFSSNQEEIGKIYEQFVEINGIGTWVLIEC
ncbi:MULTISPECIES: type I pullulanase [Anoxybacillus]|uniref:Pullulanase n=1 Tax=Anoxybacillus ayderensis TaxID=265546 RepID=A0A0D0HN03_9BACL|nr:MULTISPECIES: type I pullulanase [Anoxybacillus]EPZ37738.1 pullulanase [Anoxybacillus ayderensis]KIP21539.1 Pullulanase [Anoxybacillus ayderensis]MCX8046116.1 type I pullulanase [Anoxybacillus gonensis]NNU95665.1 type I pullulanase [Anoxybacillus sp. EFIL]